MKIYQRIRICADETLFQSDVFRVLKPMFLRHGVDFTRILGRSKDWLLGLFAGVLLALMLHYNSLLAKSTSPLIASWLVHGLGALSALLPLIFHPSIFKRKEAKSNSSYRKAPLWYYLGGFPGAMTVILAALTVNSILSLSGTVAFMLVGQVLFGMVSDHMGLLGVPKRRINLADLFVAISVLAGSILIIFGKN